ncbi:hypothetical protein CC2G_011038 [Coprinopsis cinerea AmutBmut pab1-1]|nr:hypothetical protein CC2G_011038 [Coprinopsis cinerea AmutBmut pab1-1]
MARVAGGRQDTYDLRDQLVADDHHHTHHMHAHADAVNHYGTDDEEHSVLEDDSDGEDHEDYIDDDDDSSLSIPNESIDFDLVYAFHSFAATVDGQANVVKGDSLFLMDDSNSYWWLVRVLKTQEVGYIPAENIETPFERLARLNKHRNIDLASATQAELQESLNATQDRLRNNLAGTSPVPRGRKPKGVQFTPTLSVHRYLPAVWREDEMSDEEDVEWDDEGYEDEDEELALEQMERRREEEMQMQAMEAEDPMKWDDSAVAAQQQQQMQQQQQQQQQAINNIPAALLPGGASREHQQQAALRAQQQQQLEQQREEQVRQQQMQQQMQQQELQQRQMEQQQQAAKQQDGSSESSGSRRIDPLEATETRKLTVTPTIAREDERAPGQPYLPSAIQEDERLKRQREEEAEESLRKKAKGKDKMPPPVSSTQATPTKSGGKLRKEPSKEKEEEEGKGKKKKSGFLSGMFRKKDKKGDNVSVTSMDSSENLARSSDESAMSGARHAPGSGALSPTSNLALHQQQAIRVSESTQSFGQAAPSTPERSFQQPGYQVSPLANSLRQRDQQQQALYQQYLNRSPSSPPEAQPNYGLQSAPIVMPQSSSTSSGLGPPVSRPRPGSLILTPAGIDGPGVPELSVVRVFAGKNVQTEATFKTVLLNASTTSTDLVKQAMQRFRLPAGEDAGDYYLTIKQVEGGASAVLRADEHPLGVFENLVAETMELPKVKRSSVGSISSVSSNLSMHPAITKLPMNDFSDDSAVKFYLNRRSDDGDDSLNGHEDETLIADTSHTESVDSASSNRSQYLTVSTGGANVTPERFTSPSFRFALQLVIYPDDLPDDMVFHPTTEAIVFKDTLKDATPTSPASAAHFRRKVFMFPKNVTVAEVIELGLERFGILEGVVDGGDEVEDKYTKRRSNNRVRYGLVIDTGDGRERELLPTSRVIEAFPSPPTLRAADRQMSGLKRRSLDAGHLLGSVEDVHPNDPVFILRRAVSYRTSVSSRHRNSAPLDEIALQHLHRESTSSIQSDPSSPAAANTGLKQPSRQEIIAAQRAATRANQRAILSAQTNSVRGMDVLLPGNAVLRSSRYDVNDRMRYSYVDTDGETYDISDIIEEEWRETSSPTRGDLLEGVIAKRDADKLDRVLNKIKQEKGKEREVVPASDSQRSVSPSEYSDDGERSRSVTPGSAGFRSKMSAGGAAGQAPAIRIGATTPPGVVDRRQPSIASVMSDGSGYATPASMPNMPDRETPKSTERKPGVLPKDDFGISHMMAIIEYKASQPKKPVPPPNPVDKILFGVPVDLESLHPQVREIYAPAFKQLEEIDKMLDGCIRPPVSAF